MRNLILFRNFIAKDSTLSRFQQCQIFTESTSWKTTYLSVATENGEIRILDTDCITTLSASCLLDLKDIDFIEWSENTFIVGLQPIFNALYVTLNSGVFVIVPLPCPSINDVYAFDSEVRDIQQVSWSSDFERTVLIRSSSIITVLYVTNDECEKLIDVSLQDTEEESNKFVTVGWGSTETQFRGSEGKLSKQQKEETLSVDDVSDAIQVTWKKNSAAFAVSYKCCVERRRKVKIFNQNGILMNITKDIHGLESVIDWCPSRNLISNLQILPNKNVVCFLEENGLRHGEFVLPNNFEVNRLAWNHDGTILASLGKEAKTDIHTVLIWTTSNYKWYVKHKLDFEKRILHVQWDDSRHNRLHLIFETGVYRMYEWNFEVVESESCIVRKHESKVIAVINGNKLYFTPYGNVFRPPSLPEYHRSVPFYVNAVIFAKTIPTSSTRVGNYVNLKPSIVLLYLSNNTLLAYDLTEPDSSDVQATENYIKFTLNRNGKDFTPIKFSSTAEMTAWLWLPQYRRLYFCWTRNDGYYFCVSTLCTESRRSTILIAIKVDSRILVLTHRKRDVLVHLENGAVLIYKDEKLRASQMILPESCCRMVMLYNKNMIALSENRNLYVNERIQWRGIRSFYWRHPFLVALTSDNRLVMAKIQGNDLKEILSRRIEPKSHLITIVGDQVILEMDRGNAELITPRPFVIVKMSADLRYRRYFDVFKLLRKQRINLNILYDHDPKHFMMNIHSIIENVLDPSYLTLFIMELENANVANRMFPWKYQSKVLDAPASDDKVAAICRAMFCAMNSAKNPKLILPIISALVRSNLLALAAQYAVDNNEVFFLFQLVESRKIYEAVLESYDLVYALKIAEYSKMDPGDYLPFIKKLQKMDDNFRKFNINDHLGKRVEALTYLSDCEQEVHFEECIRYIEKHELYVDGFRIFNKKQNSFIDKETDATKVTYVRYIKIAAMLADFLYTNKNFEKAAVIYEKARLNDKALECYALSGNWHTAVSLADCTYLNESDTTNLYVKLHNSLTLKGQYEDAGFVAFVFLKDGALATKNYLTARKYRKAVDATRAFGGVSIASPFLKAKLLEDAKNYAEEFIKRTNTLQLYVQRLDQIKSGESNPVEENGEFSGQESYASSETSSTCSTRSSRRSKLSVSSSAKRARRRERKLWNLKPGNPRETPSLINAIRELISDSERNFSDRIPDLQDALEQIDEYDAASDLNSKYQSLSGYIEHVISVVWDTNELNEEGGFKDLLIKCPPTFTSTFTPTGSIRNVSST